MNQKAIIELKREGNLPLTSTRARGRQNNMPSSINNAFLIDDQYDVALFTAQVHQKLERVSEDLVLAKFTPGQKEYVTEMYKLALIFNRILPDKNVAAELYEFIMSDACMRAILARNDKENILVRWMLGVREADPENLTPQEKTDYERLKERFTKKSDASGGVAG